VPLAQIFEPPAHCSSGATHCWFVGSQQPSLHAVPVVQQASPGNPHVPPPSKVVVETAQLPTPLAWLAQLAWMALSVALLSRVPALVHLMLAAAQLSSAW